MEKRETFVQSFGINLLSRGDRSSIGRYKICVTRVIARDFVAIDKATSPVEQRATVSDRPLSPSGLMGR